MAEDSVGRVAVEVVPDASDFRRKAEAELDRQRIDPKTVDLVPEIDAKMSELQARMEQIAQSLGKTVDIDIDIDMSGFEAIDRAIKTIKPKKDLKIQAAWDPTSEENIRRTLDEIESKFSKRHVLKVSAKNAKAVMAELREALDGIEGEKIRIAAEVAVNEDRIAQAKARMEATEIKVRAILNVDTALAKFQTERFLAEAAEQKAKIQVELDKFSTEATRTRLNKMFGNIVAPIRATLLDTYVRAVDAKLALMTRARNVPFLVEVAKAHQLVASATLAFLSRDRVVNLFTKVGKGGLGIASVLSGFDALQTNISQAHRALTGLFTNLPNVAGVTTAILGIAGALLSTAASAASFAGQIASALPVLLALPGIAIGIGVMVAAFRDFGTVLPGVKDQLKDLQPLISDAFWGKAKAGVQGLADSIMGPLKAGLAGTADVIGGFVGALAGQLGTALAGDNGLASWFGNLQNSVVAFQTAIPNLVSIFMQFGQVGSAMLEPLAFMVADLVKRFDEWFAMLVFEAGGIDAFAEKAVAALQGIIEFVIQLGAIFGAVFRASQESGTMTFTSLAEKMKAFADTGGLERLQASLTTLFTAAHQMWDNFGAAASDSLGGAMENITKLLGAVLPVVGTIMGTLTQLLAGAVTPEATAGIQAFVAGVAKGVEAMQPAFALLGPLIGELGPVLGKLATQIGTIFGALTPTIESLIPAITPIIEILGGGLVEVIMALKTPIETLGKILVEALTSPAFRSALESIVGVIMSLLPILTPIIGLVGKLLPIMLPLVSAVLEPVAQLIEMIVPLLTPIGDVIGQIFAALGPIIPVLVQLVMAVLTPLLPVIVQLLTAISPLLTMGVQLIAAVLTPLLGVLTTLIEIALIPLTFALGLVADLIGVVVTAIMGGFTAALAWITEALGGISTGLDGFLEGWKSLWNTVFGFFQGVWEGLLTWIKDLLGIHSPSRWFLDLATNLLQGMLNGLETGWAWITEFFTAAWAWFMAIVTTTFNLVVAIVTGAWDFVVGLFTAAWALLSSIVSGGWAKVIGFFADAVANVKTTVSDAWTKVTTFFTDGITNAVNLVKGLPGKIVSALGNLGTTLFSAGKDLVQGLLNGIGSLASTIGSWFLNKIPAWIRDPFKAALGIHSPSTVFAGFGENIIDGLIRGMETSHHKVFRSMDGLAAGMADTQFALPTVNSGGLASVAAQVAAAMSGSASRVLNYYAAPGGGLSSEEELFAAAGRGRMVW